jgi:hypothetical protein
MLTLALSSARTSAQVAETTSRLTALKQATILFKEDIGYLPAVLNAQRGLAEFPVFPGPDTGSPQSMYRFQAQQWYSITSPAEFFIGYGNRDQDGYGILPDTVPGDPDFPDSEEIPRFGIRHPSLDGVWRATDIYAFPGNGDGSLESRLPAFKGKLFGPYLEIENDQMLGRIKLDDNNPLIDPVTGQIKIFYPGDPDYPVDDLDELRAMPIVIVDTWGGPIRYYRAVYPGPADTTLPETGISRFYPQSSSYNRPTLSDYFVLRPSEFDPNHVIDGTLADFMDGQNVISGDTSTTFELQTGQFAYFSAGPDNKANNFIRADAMGLAGNDGRDATDEVNADNLVEVGP